MAQGRQGGLLTYRPQLWSVQVRRYVQVLPFQYNPMSASYVALSVAKAD